MSEGAQYIGLTLAELEGIRKQSERIDSMGLSPRETALQESMNRLDPEQASALRANDRQVGGSHYQKGSLQHWDVVERYGVPYLEGVGSKYPLRWREKGGLEDLEKTLHYIDKILERPADHPLWERRFRLHTDLVRDSNELCEAHRVGPVERRVVLLLLQGAHRQALQSVRGELAEYIDRVRLETSPGSPEDGGHYVRAEPEEPTQAGRTIALPQGSVGEVRISGDAVHVTWRPA